MRGLSYSHSCAGSASNRYYMTPAMKESETRRTWDMTSLAPTQATRRFLARQRLARRALPGSILCRKSPFKVCVRQKYKYYTRRTDDVYPLDHLDISGKICMI